MTDHELRDLLHERVADVMVPDLSEVAWRRATRIRRRRAAAVVAASVAVVAVGSLAVAEGGGVPGGGRSSDPMTQLPSPSAPTSPGPAPTGSADAGRSGARPDARYRGVAVYWGPAASQEQALPRVASPFPETVDLSAPAPALADRPITAALAAYALLDDAGGTRLLLLAPDGTLRSVDTSSVGPYDDGAGNDISVADEHVLSPTGEYLAFPQAAGRVRVLTLATGTWRTIDTGRGQVVTMQWMGDTDLWFPPTTQGGRGSLFSVLDGRRSGATNLAAPAGPFDDGAAYGRWRTGPLGTAQSWGRVTGVPVPPGGTSPAQVLLVDGFAPADDALLVLGPAATSGDVPRPDPCCDVAFWLDDRTVVYESQGQPRRLVAWRVGTHDVGLVTSLEGVDRTREVLVSSYARIWDRR